MSDKTFKIVDGDISDGYHTFKELYDHRCLLFVNLCVRDALNCAWRRDYPGWFVLYWKSPFGQISYHIPEDLRKLVEGKIRRDEDHVFDGHTGPDVLKRLRRSAENPQGVEEIPF